jgi:dipeptidase E
MSMMLYLTSTGFENGQVADNFKRLITSKSISDLSFLVISVQDDEFDAVYLQKTKDELKKIGATDIEVFELKDRAFVPIKEYDVIYVCGGNTYVYLDRMKQIGLDKFIINSVKNNKSIYVGVSAGSIIAGQDISIAGWGSEGDSNDFDLQDLAGLGLTDIVVFPHYRDDLKIEVANFRKKYSYQVYELTDNQALCLNYSNSGSLKDIVSMEFIGK